MAGPLRGPLPRVQRSSNYGVNNHFDLINKIVDNMGLSSEAINEYVAAELLTGNKGSQAAARTKADDIFKKLGNISDRSLSRLNKELSGGKRAEFSNYLNAPASNVSFVQDHLSRLIELNRNVETKFMKPLGEANYHPLNGPLASAAEAMISGGVAPNMIAQTLNYIKKQKDVGAGSKLLGGISGLKGAAASSYFSKNLSTSSMQDYYQTHTGNMENSSIEWLRQSRQLGQAKEEFVRSLSSDKSLAPEDKVVLTDFVNGSIQHISGLNELKSRYKTGGMGSVRSGEQEIIKVQQTAMQRKLTVAQTIDRYAFMRTTRGKTHATVGLVRGMMEGFVAPEVGLALMAGGGLQNVAQFAAKYIPNQAIANLAVSGGLIGGGNPIAGLLPGGGQTTRALSGIGMQNNLIGTYLYALAQGRSPGDIVKSFGVLTQAGLPMSSKQQLQNLFTTGVYGQGSFLGGEAASHLSMSMLNRGEIGPNTSLESLAYSMAIANPDKNPKQFSLTQSGVGGLANKWSNILAMGMLAGIKPDDIATTAQNGGGTMVIEKGLSKLLPGMPMWMQASVLEGMGASNPLQTASQLQNPVAASSGGSLGLDYANTAVRTALANPRNAAAISGLARITATGDEKAIRGIIPGYAQDLSKTIPDISNISAEDLAKAVYTQDKGMQNLGLGEADTEKLLAAGFEKAGAKKERGDSAASPVYVSIVDAPLPGVKSTGAGASNRFNNGGR